MLFTYWKMSETIYTILCQACVVIALQKPVHRLNIIHVEMMLVFMRSCCLYKHKPKTLPT